VSSAPRTSIEPPDAIYRRVHAAVRAQRTSTLRPHLKNAAALGVASILAAGVVLTASQIVYGNQAMGLHAGVKSASLLAFVAITLLALTLASTMAALWRGRTGLGASTAILFAMAVMTAPLYALLSLSFPVHELAEAVVSVSISPWGARCFVLASLVGALVLGCFAVAMRAAAPIGTRLRSMVLGSAAGAWAGLAVFVFCPSSNSLHLMIGHVLPVAAFTAIGAVALPAILRP
jgi:Negative regulator of sigma F